MMTPAEIFGWLQTLDTNTNFVAISDRGLSLIEVTPEGQPTGAYLEIDGAPQSEENE
jgi:hypothetical protein